MTENTNKRQRVGILAYGSLINDPGDEIKAHCNDIIEDVWTNFNVEFARRSESRGYGPTLVKVENGGRSVRGQIFEMNLSEDQAKKALFRREKRLTCEESERYSDAKISKSIDTIVDKWGFDIVHCSNFRVNIKKSDLTAKNLAEYAIESVKRSRPFCDGISYLIAAKECGIVTELSDAYEREIIDQSKCSDLIQALIQELAKGILDQANRTLRHANYEYSVRGLAKGLEKAFSP